jgi:hypothetical protein
MEKATETIKVEVAYALRDQQALHEVHVPPGASVRQAIEISGILGRFPEIDLEKNRVGIFGKLTALDTPLRPGDRVEIYRPLIADPKEVRKLRAAEGKKMKRGAGSVGEGD